MCFGINPNRFNYKCQYCAVTHSCIKEYNKKARKELDTQLFQFNSQSRENKDPENKMLRVYEDKKFKKMRRKDIPEGLR